MNDTDLREMFDRREGDVRAPRSAPAPLIRRARRRQLATAAAGAAIALAVTLGSIEGLRWLGGSDAGVPGGVGSGPTTTTTINGISITYPEGWFAVDPAAIGIEPNDMPRTLPTLVLALTRDDPRTAGVLGCPRLADVPEGQVLMTVQETTLAVSGDASRPWPVPLVHMDLGGEQVGGCYEGWTFLQAVWSAAGRSFDARLGFAPDASDADRAALQSAFASMTFAPGSVSGRGDTQVASGTLPGGRTWSLVASRAGQLCWTVQVEAANQSSATGSCLDEAGVRPPNLSQLPLAPDGTLLSGVMPPDVESVTASIISGDPAGPTRVEGPELLSAPAAWAGARFIVWFLPGSGSGTFRFRDGSGNEVYTAQDIAWPGENGSPSPAPEALDNVFRYQIIGGVVTARGEIAGTSWKVEILYYRDGVRLTIGGRPEELGVLRLDEPMVRPIGSAGSGALVLVLTNLSVDRVAVESPGRTWVGRWIPAATGAGGKARLWVVETPGTGDGTLLLDGRPADRVSLP